MKSDKSAKCDVCETPHFERNNYFYGKQFTVRDLLQEQRYFNKKRWLLNRMVLGWGVVCGLGVSWKKDKAKLEVKTGMALDCCGHEIIVCEPQYLELEQYEEACRCAEEKREYEGKFVLCLEYEKCETEPIELPPVGCNKEERTEYNRIREGFKLRLKKWEEACPKQPFGHIACLDRFKHDTGKPEGEKRPSCHTETLHEHLCKELGKGCPECESCDCVILATIYVKAGKAEQSQQANHQQQHQHEVEHKSVEVRVDTCTDRRLVYSNSTLYDLIYCHHGDLPHIVDFNWRAHTYPKREVSWEKFVQMVRDGLTVYFDQKMTDHSLNGHTFFISFLHKEEGTGVYIVKRIPVMRIQPGSVGDCYTATFIADKDWIQDELTAKNSQLANGADIEITLRGSRIWNRKGKALDGEFLGDKLPTGNGTQGGDFVDWFRVLPRGAQQGRAETYRDF